MVMRTISVRQLPLRLRSGLQFARILRRPESSLQLTTAKYELPAEVLVRIGAEALQVAFRTVVERPG